MNKDIHILSVGAATQDVFLQGDVLTPVNEHGDHFIELHLGDKLYLDGATFSTGGNACNAAVTFARQGLHSSFVGAVGDDPAGLAVMDIFSREHIDTTYATVVKGKRTGYSVILLAPGGERTILRVKGEVEADMGHEDFFLHLDCDWLYLSSIGTFELTEKVIRHAAEQGVKMAFNPGTLDLKDPSTLRPLVDKVDVLALNKEETALLFSGETMQELAVSAAKEAGVVAIVSDGPNGVAVCDGQKLYVAGMYEDVPVIDRLGAGDAFGSGFTSAFAQGKSIPECITLASANSTSVVQQIGAKPGILHADAELHDMPIEITDI